ncbi:MAG: hypothetical protein JWP23_948, partial [Phenylobacterium sp.]|nr:hypothetical protein [Phenylobacterium sp.]
NAVDRGRPPRYRRPMTAPKLAAGLSQLSADYDTLL